MSCDLEMRERYEHFQRCMEDVCRKIEEAESLHKQEKFKEAIQILAPAVKPIDEMLQDGFFGEKESYKYLSFDSPFGNMLYHYYERPQKEIRYAPYNYGKMYYVFGSLLVDLRNFTGARIALEKAMKWDPTNAEYALEHAETYKMEGNLNRFLELTKKAFRIAFLPENMSRLYRNLGYYFVEKELWDVAIECFSLAYNYDHGECSTKIIDSELRYIYDKSNRTATIHLNYDNLEKYAQQYDFPYGPDSDIVLFAYHQGRMRVESREYEDAKFLLTIANNLAQDDDVKKLLDKVNRVLKA